MWIYATIACMLTNCASLMKMPNVIKQTNWKVVVKVWQFNLNIHHLLKVTVEYILEETLLFFFFLENKESHHSVGFGYLHYLVYEN